MRYGSSGASAGQMGAARVLAASDGLGGAALIGCPVRVAKVRPAGAGQQGPGQGLRQPSG